MSTQAADELKTVDQTKDNVMKDDENRDKFIRLLGGKKPQNKEATNVWLKKTRSDAEETTLAKGLENQYTSTMSQVVEGKTKRHEGIGFQSQDSLPNETPPLPNKDTMERSRDVAKQTPKVRDRSRSPLDRNKNGSEEAKTENPADKPVPVNTKKQFYMQFKKSTD